MRHSDVRGASGWRSTLWIVVEQVWTLLFENEDLALEVVKHMCAAHHWNEPDRRTSSCTVQISPGKQSKHSRCCTPEAQ